MLKLKKNCTIDDKHFALALHKKLKAGLLNLENLTLRKQQQQ